MVEFSFVGINFEKEYDELLNYMQLSGIRVDKEIQTELAAYLFVIVDIAVFHSDNRLIINSVIKQKIQEKIPSLVISELESKIDFYSEFIRGKKPRAELLTLCDDSVRQKCNINPLTRITMAFADRVLNPACIVDYDNAPMRLSGIFDIPNELECFTSIGKNVTQFGTIIEELVTLAETTDRERKSSESNVSGGVLALVIFAIILLFAFIRGF